MVGATFLATNYHPSLDMVKHHDRKSLDNNGHPQMQIYPGIGFFRFRARSIHRGRRTPSISKVFTCRPRRTRARGAVCQENYFELARRAYRRPENRHDLEALLAFYEEGRQNGTFEDGIEMALRRILASPQFLVRVENEPANQAAAKPIESAIWNWLPGCHSSSGAPFPTTN